MLRVLTAFLLLTTTAAEAARWRLPPLRDWRPRATECVRRIVDEVTGRIGRSVRPPAVLGNFGGRLVWHQGHFVHSPNMVTSWEERDRILFGRSPVSDYRDPLRVAWRPESEPGHRWPGRLTTLLTIPHLPDVPEFESAMREHWRKRLGEVFWLLNQQLLGVSVDVPDAGTLFEFPADGSARVLELALPEGVTVRLFEKNGHGDAFVDGSPYNRVVFYLRIQPGPATTFEQYLDLHTLLVALLFDSLRPTD